LKGLLEDIQERARLYMVLLNQKNANKIREMFTIKRNLMVIDGNEVDDVASGLTKLTKTIARESGKLTKRFEI